MFRKIIEIKELGILQCELTIILASLGKFQLKKEVNVLTESRQLDFLESFYCTTLCNSFTFQTVHSETSQIMNYKVSFGFLSRFNITRYFYAARSCGQPHKLIIFLFVVLSQIKSTLLCSCEVVFRLS